MRKTILFFSIWLISISSFAGAPVTTSLAPMLEKVLPAIVNIRAQIKATDPDAYRKPENHQSPQNNDQDIVPDKYLSVGSGVVVDDNKGYILTNAHVVDQAEAVTVTTNDGRHYTAKIIGLDRPSDIAVLQIQAKGLNSIATGDSNILKVGDPVVAIGNPFGLNESVTSGIVSALGRTTLGIESYENFIQTDASINPGNSGGALVDTQGKLVGINTAILTPERGSIGIGFAIPSNMAISVMHQLIAYGNVRRGALGIGAQDITPELATSFNLSNTKGAVITQVIPDTPAAKAGLKVGDVITQVNNAMIKNANDVVNEVGLIRVESKANITVLRNNKPVEVSVVLTDLQKRRASGIASDPFLFGVGLKDFTLLSPIHGDVKGILVASVDQDTNAWHSDLRPGDVIVSVNQQKVTRIDELKKAASSSKETLLLNVLRGPGAIFLVINRE